MKKSQKKGFTLIELLVVVLILGILAAVAIPAYLSSVNDAKTKTANNNAKTIATALQIAYVKGGGVAYTASPLADTAILADLGGTIPANPCSSSATPVAADWGIVVATGSKSVTITPVNSASCSTAPSPITITG